jgi:sugar transferase (PEP-CTERM/EpsH1 system associated)
MNELLFIAHRIPYPPNKGDKIRSFNILRHLARSWRIHLGAFVDDPDDMRYREKLEALCESTCLLPLSPRLARVRSLSGLLRNTALSVPYFRDRRMCDWINERLASRNLRRVFVYSSPMAQYVTDSASSRVPCVVDFVDVDSDKWHQYAQRKQWPLSWLYRREAEYLLRFERDVALSADASLFVSADEAALFRQLVPEAAERVSNLDNGVDHAFFTPASDYEDPYDGSRAVIVFTGAMDYWANIDAVTWFSREVFPAIRESENTARFVIVGARPSDEVRSLASIPGVSVTGAVKDIRPYLSHARVAVAPMRVARGVQNKVLEAMAMARPVVASRLALEGIETAGHAGLCMADSAADFATATLGYLGSGRGDVFGDSRQWVRSRYDWDINLGKLDRYLGSPRDGEGVMTENSDPASSLAAGQ